jgi:hypothetical protein
VEREVLQEWVAKLGLQYSGDLVCSWSTHLVCRDLLSACNETKYVKALHWGIHIVSFRWIYDSLQAGRLLTLSAYKCDEPSPAYLALSKAVARRIKLTAAQQMGRQALQQLCANTNLPSVIQPGAVPDDKRHGQQDLPDNGDHNHQQRASNLLQQAATNYGFTFDVPIGRSALNFSPRLYPAAGPTQMEPTQERATGATQTPPVNEPDAVPKVGDQAASCLGTKLLNVQGFYLNTFPALIRGYACSTSLSTWRRHPKHRIRSSHWAPRAAVTNRAPSRRPKCPHWTRSGFPFLSLMRE